MAVVAAVKTDGVSSKESSHQCSKGYQTRSKKKMGMVRNEYPCVTGRFRLGQEFGKAFEKILGVFII